MNAKIIRANYANEIHGKAIIELLNSYILDNMGGGKPLSEYTKTNLISKLSTWPNAFSFLAFQEDKAVGLINCFLQFSTFQCRNILNIHDIVILPDYRQQGIGYQLLEAAELLAKEYECCKITLEVLEGNIPAQNLYRKFGFGGYELNPQQGKALFWQKIL